MKQWIYLIKIFQKKKVKVTGELIAHHHTAVLILVSDIDFLN